MQSADFLSAVFFYLKVGENLNQNWIVENLNNAFSTWNGKLGELWGLVTTGPQTFKGGAVWSVMQTLHNGMVGIGYALVVLFFAISLCKNTMNFHELKRPEAAIHYFLRFVAAKALVGYGMVRNRPWFFPSACGHYSIKTIYDNFRELLFACNIPHTGNGPRVHDFRHTFAVHTLEKQLSDGYDPMVIVPRLAAYLGHKSYRETCWYIHLTVASFPELSQKLDRAFVGIIPVGGETDEEN